MTTILDKEQEQFVVDLAISDLERLNVNIEEFIRKHKKICLKNKKKNKKNNCYRRTIKMSKISKEGFEQIQVIKSALDSMFNKLEASGNFDTVKDEFEAIAGIVSEVGNWEEV